MIYASGRDWLDAPDKRIMLFGMSGLGKTRLSNILRESGGWFHYSVDYRIGTRYMGEHIADNFKREAMKVPLLRELLLSDSIYVASNITFDNLAPLSTYLGKPGDADLGGLPFDEYMLRQNQHRQAELAAMADTVPFIERSERIYGYRNFVCDTSGSICEIVDPDDPDDPTLHLVSRNLLPIWLKGGEAHTAELVRRFDRAPKPMYYQPDFLETAWRDYLVETDLPPERIQPDEFVRWTYARALARRQPRYAAMARHGVTIEADDVARVNSAAELEALVADRIDATA
ncbi:ATPase [Palleronia sp. LCG004]|uniref:ATPase n=1 Tax=Palleronia sp. LCG004 TaxID=3079304 RepID=UPI002943EBED|nr:ATPase [Palleronia sp. LCG004]WOI56740.1 ATPase [Palleronia sp. LCG004]